MAPAPSFFFLSFCLFLSLSAGWARRGQEELPRAASGLSEVGVAGGTPSSNAANSPQGICRTRNGRALRQANAEGAGGRVSGWAPEDGDRGTDLALDERTQDERTPETEQEQAECWTSERHGRGQGIGTSRRRKGDRAEDGRRCTSGRQTGTGDAGSADAGQIDACVG